MIALNFFWLLAIPSSAFVVKDVQRLSETALWSKVRRGKLGSILDPSDVTPAPPKRTKKKKAPKKTSDTDVSPDLAAWANGVSNNDETLDAVISSVTTTSEDSETYSSFSNKKKPSRRERQSNRQATDQARNTLVQEQLDQLQSAIDTKKTVPEILQIVEAITNLPSTSNTNIWRSSHNYRLLWVGSDDAVCHVGTGLHKVPLARLQEVFLTTNKGRMEWIEVIRILGPFPNVKNTLQGLAKVQNRKLTITWDSLIDGTGKEVLAGTTENTRVVPLDIDWSDPNAIVARVPSSSDDGSNVMVFVKEEFLDDQLEILRVA